MKKILLTTSALTLLAGAAAAGVTITADGRIGVTNNAATSAVAATTHFGAVTAGAASTSVAYRYQVHFKADTQTDGGLTIGAHMYLRDQQSYTAVRNVGAELWVGNGMATLHVGNTAGAIARTSGVQSVPTVGFTGMSFQSILGAAGYNDKSFSGHGITDLVALDVKLGQATISVSGGKANNTEVAAKFKIGTATIGIGQDNGSSTLTAGAGGANYGGTYLTAGFDAGGAKINASYVRTNVGPNMWAVGATMPAANGKVSVYAVNIDNKSGYGIGYKMGLGGGAAFGVGVERSAKTGTTNAEAGISFSF